MPYPHPIYALFLVTPLLFDLVSLSIVPSSFYIQHICSLPLSSVLLVYSLLILNFTSEIYLILGSLWLFYFSTCCIHIFIVECKANCLSCCFSFLLYNASCEKSRIDAKLRKKNLHIKMILWANTCLCGHVFWNLAVATATANATGKKGLSDVVT